MRKMNSELLRKLLLLTGFAAVLILLLLFIVRCFFIEPELLTVKTSSLPLAKWQEKLNGFSILLVSDPHLEPGSFKTERLKREAAKLQPDVVLLLGDYTRRSCYPEMGCSEKELETFFRAFSAKYGVYAIFGNHDLWFPRRKLKEIAAQCGVRFLVNEAVTIRTPQGAVRIFGTEEFDVAEKDLFDAILPPDGTPEILATHDPDLFRHAPDRFALAVAGHYHGGQLRWTEKIPFFLFGEMIRPGLNSFNGRYLYHTVGLGQDSFRARFHCQPEIVLLKLYAPGFVPPVDIHNVNPKYWRKTR